MNIGDTRLDNDLVRQFEDDGFCLVEGVLPPPLVERLRQRAEHRLATQDKNHFQRFAHHGSLIPMNIDDDPLAELLTSAELHTAFASLGFTDPRWISGYVIAKPPRSPGLWWHQDWWAWNHDISFAQRPAQIFCMIYLQPTSKENGGLRVIPRSHRERHELHDALPEPHTLTIERQKADTVSHLPASGELTIEAQPGDLVIGDVRVIHATHPNETDSWRTAIDLLFTPDFRDLPAEFRAHYVGQFCLPPAGWWDDPDHPLHSNPVSRVLPTYSGPEQPPVDYRRLPRWPMSTA